MNTSVLDTRTEGTAVGKSAGCRRKNSVGLNAGAAGGGETGGPVYGFFTWPDGSKGPAQRWRDGRGLVRLSTGGVLGLGGTPADGLFYSLEVIPHRTPHAGAGSGELNQGW